MHERCEKGLVLHSEVTHTLGDLDQRARAALPEGSDLFRLYDSRMVGVTDWWRQTIGSRYVAPGDSANIWRRIDLVRQVLKAIEPEFLRSGRRTSELYLQAGDIFPARQALYCLLKGASARIDIADPYLDPDVFDYVDALDPGLAFRLLTAGPKSLFTKQLHSLQATRAGLLARTNDQHHDRFIILDGSDVWHLGASINGLGKKACRVSRVTEDTDRDRILLDFENWWSAGAPI